MFFGMTATSKGPCHGWGG